MKKFMTIVFAAALSFVAFGTTASFAEGDKVSGTFTGASNHVTTGTVTIQKTQEGNWVLVLGSDFVLDGAPDPGVGFGKDGNYVAATHLGNLQSLTGLHVYEIPADIDVSDFNEVYIWCTQFSVPLGVASID